MILVVDEGGMVVGLDGGMTSTADVDNDDDCVEDVDDVLMVIDGGEKRSLIQQ